MARGLSLPKIPSGLDWRYGENHRIILGDVYDLVRAQNVRGDMFKSRWRLEAENLFLRHQLNIALRYEWTIIYLFGNP